MNQNSSYIVPSYPQLKEKNHENKNKEYSDLNENLVPSKKNMNVNEIKHLLFYSTFCKYSSELLEHMKKNNFLEKIDLICIDSRFINDNITYISLPNNQSMPLPPMINSVPTLCILPNHEILTGKKILNYFQPISKNIQDERNKINLEPNPFSLDKETIGSYGVSSDNFSFWDCQTEELSACGDGGERQMYNYSSIQNEKDSQIYTPSEEIKEKKQNMSLEQLQEKRNNEI